jgi:hypothetical protein
MTLKEIQKFAKTVLPPPGSASIEAAFTTRKAICCVSYEDLFAIRAGAILKRDNQGRGIPKPDFVLSNLDDAEKWGFHAACSLGKPIPLKGRRPGRITGHKGIYVVVNMAERSDYDRL